MSRVLRAASRDARAHGCCDGGTARRSDMSFTRTTLFAALIATAAFGSGCRRDDANQMNRDTPTSGTGAGTTGTGTSGTGTTGTGTSDTTGAGTSDTTGTTTGGAAGGVQ